MVAFFLHNTGAKGKLVDSEQPLYYTVNFQHPGVTIPVFSLLFISAGLALEIRFIIKGYARGMTLKIS